MMVVAIGLLAVIESGCQRQAGGSRAEEAVSASKTNDVAEKPQPKLPTTELWVGREVLTVEVARTREQIAKGMMFREGLGEDEGMLFVFPSPREVSFFMRNTTIPLSCAYVDSEGAIREIHKMEPLDETAIPSASDNIQYVLEVRQGWFGRHNVTEGMVMRTEEGSLQSTFFGPSTSY